LIEPTSPRPDAATAIFNLPDYRVTDTEVLAFGERRVFVEATAEAGCPSCGVISTRDTGQVLEIVDGRDSEVVGE
jgi:hypothetical protein